MPQTYHPAEVRNKFLRLVLSFSSLRHCTGTMCASYGLQELDS